jgi:hypothetical protein
MPVSSLSPVVIDDAELDVLPSRPVRPWLRPLGLGALALGAAAASMMLVRSPSWFAAAATRETHAAGQLEAKQAEPAIAPAPLPPTAAAPAGKQTAPAAPTPGKQTAPQKEAAPALEKQTAPVLGKETARASDKQPALAAAKQTTPAPPPKAAGAPQPVVQLLLDQLALHGGKLTPQQLASAIEKAQPKLDACYGQTLAHKPHLKGKLQFSFTIKPNGKASIAKLAGGTIKDAALIQCSADVIANAKYPKPRKQAVKVKLALQYKPS